MVEIEEADELRNLFLKRLQEYYSNRKEIHVSDLVFCLRKAYFRRVKPEPPTAVELGFFLDGARRHSALEALGLGVAEKEVERFGVVGHIDVLLDGNAPVEFKTTRMMKDDISEHYIRQLAYYCILLNTRFGYLVIQHINERRGEQFQFKKIMLSEADQKMFENEMKVKRAILEEALKNGNWTMLPQGEKWECENKRGKCQYHEKCWGGGG